jgi:signal transduction histidine kinase
MIRIIEDLLDVTRMEAGGLTIEHSRLSAAQVATDAVDAQRGLASSRSLELRLELPPELPDIRADRDRLLQVFENLIANAIKFTPAGGRITVGATRQEADVLFWVRDTGPGIAVEDQPHLFDRFWQARSTTGRGGAGLGLPIVKGIVEAHGGRVSVESAPGSGSAFLFTIPIARHGERTPADLRAEPAADRRVESDLPL